MHTNNIPSNEEITAENFLAPGQNFEVMKDKNQAQEIQSILTITPENLPSTNNEKK